MLTDAKIKALKPGQARSRSQTAAACTCWSRRPAASTGSWHTVTPGSSAPYPSAPIPMSLWPMPALGARPPGASCAAAVDPGAVVKAEKQAAVAAATNTFAAVGAEWLPRKMVRERKSASTLRRAQWLLDILNEGIGDRPIERSRRPSCWRCCETEAQGKHETVKRLRSTASPSSNSESPAASANEIPPPISGARFHSPSTPYAAIVDLPALASCCAPSMVIRSR